MQNDANTNLPENTAQSPTTLPTLTPFDYKTPTPPPILEGDKSGEISFTAELATGQIFTLRQGSYRWSLDGRLFGGIARGGDFNPVAYSLELAAADGTRFVMAFPTLPESGAYDVITYDPRARAGAYARLEMPSADENTPALYLDDPEGTITIHNTGTALSALFELTLTRINPAYDENGAILPQTMTVSGVFHNMPITAGN